MAFLDEAGVTTLTSDIKTLTDATYPANATIINGYNSSSAYTVGDFCIHDGLFYKCNTAIASGGETWTAAHWTQTNVTSEWGTKMVVLSYGSSTWADFQAAFDANAIVYCKASSNSNPATGSQGRMAFMAYVGYSGSTITNVEFQYYRSVSSHSDSQQGDQVFIYKLESTNGGKWTVTTREAATKMVAGTGLSSSYASGTLTMSLASGYGIPDGGTTGQVLAKNSDTNRDVVWVNQSGGGSTNLSFTDTRVATSAFVSDVTYTDYPYRAAINLTGVTASMIPEVMFNLIDAICGIYAPVAESYSGGVYIYTTQIPTATCSAEIDETTFLSQVSDSGTLTFTYTTSWDLTLATYGITITGTPNNGDTIVVTYDTSNSTATMVLNGSILIPTILCFTTE